MDGGFRPQLGRSATHRAIPKPDVQHRSGAAASRPWSAFSKVALFLQTGPRIEDPYHRLAACCVETPQTQLIGRVRHIT